MRDFIVHLDNLAGFEILTNEEKGLLFTAMVEYARDGTEPTLQDRALLVIWLNLKRRMDFDFEAYSTKKEQSRTAANLRWQKTAMQNDADACGRINSNAEACGRIKRNANDANTNTNTNTKSKSNNNYICGADAPSAVVDKSDSTHDVEDESDKVPYKEIIDYLNQKLGTHYLPKSKDSRKAIHARWAEGYRLEDFKTVIDNMIERWGKDAKMADYLRPITLFSPKFESYLNLKPVAEAKPANQFHNFEQRDEIDFDALEAQLDSQLARDLGGMP